MGHDPSRTRLLAPLVPRIATVKFVNAATEERRLWVLADAAVRVFAPVVMDRVAELTYDVDPVRSLREHAAALRRLDAVTPESRVVAVQVAETAAAAAWGLQADIRAYCHAHAYAAPDRARAWIASATLADDGAFWVAAAATTAAMAAAAVDAVAYGVAARAAGVATWAAEADDATREAVLAAAVAAGATDEEAHAISAQAGKIMTRAARAVAATAAAAQFEVIWEPAVEALVRAIEVNARGL